MFEHKFSTNLINEKIPLSIQLLLWAIVMQLEKKMNLDYLQVMELFPDGNFLRVSHSQEEPQYYQIVNFNIKKLAPDLKPFEATIFIIDEGGNAVMMFDYEY